MTDDEVLTKAAILDQYGGADLSVLKSDYENVPLEKYISEKLRDATFESVPSVGDSTVTLTAGHGTVVGNYLEIWESNTFEQYEIIAVAVNDITLAIEITYPYSLNAVIKVTNLEMNVDGSVDPACFTFESESGTWDVTRFIPILTHTQSPDDGKFGGLDALDPEEGLILENNIDFPITPQTPDGLIRFTLDNVKSNFDFRFLGYDLTYSDKAPAGIYSTSIRKTVNGDDKSGTVFRIYDEFPEFIPGFTGKNRIEARVRADLTDLVSFRIKVHGHLTNRPSRVVI